MNDPESIYLHCYTCAVAGLNALLAQSGPNVPAKRRLEAQLSRLQLAHIALGNEPATVPLRPCVAEEAARLVDSFERDAKGPSWRSAIEAAAELADGWDRLPEFIQAPTRGGLRRLDIVGRWPVPDQPAPEGERERDTRGGADDDGPVTRG